MILITRPKRQSINLETALKLKGYKTFLESLYKIKFYKKEVTYNKNNYYIFPSINSVQSLIDSKQINKFRKSNILAIGKKVEEALINSGCKNILLIAADSETLIKKIAKPKFINCHFTYLCSNIINESFLKKVSKHKVSIEAKVIYKTIPNIQFSKKLIYHLNSGNISGAIFLSKLPVETFLRYLIEYNCADGAKNIHIYCISERVAELFRQKKFRHIHVASIPTEISVLKSIKKNHYI